MIAVEHLSKRYGRQLAVNDITFGCEPGTVTGFLGPNGAGKSTTMRMICGLTPPTSGSAVVLDTSYRKLDNPGRHVGVLLDASAQHAGRSGREVLTLSAKVLGVAPSRVLVLDEPANGLDPEGIFWMRELLREFASRAGTVLLSSHLLREVEAIADHLVVINDGRIVSQGRKEELLASVGVVVRSLEPDALATALTDAGLTFTEGADGAALVDAEPEAVGRAAAAAGIVLIELRPAESAGLEQLYLSLTRAVPEEVAA